jgi:hypothetical protein
MPYQPAVLGSARLGNFRLGYRSAVLAATRAARVGIVLNGADVRTRVRVGSLTIHDGLNESPNSCQLTVDGTAPVPGQTLRVTVGIDAPVLLFDGTLQRVDLSYEGVPTQLAWACAAIDDLARLNRRRPFGTWTNISATTIAQSIISAYAPGFTAVGVEAGLPLVSVNFDGSEGFTGCLTQLAKLIGGYFYVEDLDVHLFQSEATALPATIDSTHPFLNDPPISCTTDVSQLQTRVFGKGHGETLLSDVAVGETMLPVTNVNTWFNAAGGSVISTTQILTYTGKTQASPTTAPTVKPTVGAGIDTGTHQWAYTFVTASGETLPSLLSAVKVLETLPASPAIASVTPSVTGSGPAAGVTVTYGVAVIKDIAAFSVTGLASGASDLVTATPVVAPGGSTYTVTVTALAAHVGRTIGLFRADTGGAGNTSYSFIAYAIVPAAGALTLGPDNGLYNTSNNFFGFYGAPAGWTGYGQVQQAALSAIAIGPAGTTSRKVYRTAAGGSQLKLQQTIANNTATVGVTDSTADASLGANAPTSDTSGLVLNAVSTTSVFTAAGATTVNLVSGAAFLAAGGWGTVAGLPFRYTGKATNQLTGIPATGPGSITAAIPSGSTVMTLTALLGVPASGAGSVVAAMSAGDPVSIWVQRDDLAAQAAAIIRDGSGDGVYEGPPISDERRGEESLIALCDATLDLYSYPIVTVNYATRDLATKSGKPVTINLASPPISETLTIQSVDISEIDISPGTAPRFAVTASSVRFSLEDLLRRMAA